VTIITDENCTGYSRYAHPERPARITATVARLKNQNELPIEWTAPSKISDGQILRAHAPEMLARLKIPRDFDNDTPFFENISDYARASAAASIDALKIARTGENVFSLMRPPGHHATREKSMGFCYLNNIAIAVLEAIAPQTAISSPSPQRGEGRGEEAKTVSNSKPITPTLSPLGRGEGAGFKRVAVFDFDVHHGNGTEAILLNQPGVEYFSVHQYPCYPGTGSRNAGVNCFNYPVAPGEARETWRATLTRALGDMRQFRPDLVGVSAGFDAYLRDPLADGALEVEDFHWLGRELRGLGAPFFSLLEGGYSRDLPELIFAYLKGAEGK